MKRETPEDLENERIAAGQIARATGWKLVKFHDGDYAVFDYFVNDFAILEIKPRKYSVSSMNNLGGPYITEGKLKTLLEAQQTRNLTAKYAVKLWGPAIFIININDIPTDHVETIQDNRDGRIEKNYVIPLDKMELIYGRR